MKLTPEQKAFFEYGKALGELKMFRMDHRYWGCVRLLDRRHAWRIGDGFDEELQDIVNKHAYLIRDAWQKRAACRRTCGQCIHFSPNEWGLRKDGCLKKCCGIKSNRCAVGCRYWQTERKAGNEHL